MAQQQARQEAFRLSNQHQLGALQKEYGKWNAFISILLLILIFLLFLPFCLLFLYIFPENPLIYIITIFTLFVLLCIISLPTYRRRHSRDFLCENGFIIIKCRDQQIVASESIHWSQIATIWHHVKRTTTTDSEGGSTTTITHIYTLQRLSGDMFGSSIEGKTWVNTNVELGKHIEQMTHPYLFPHATSTYEQNAPVIFGPLTLHGGGIEHQGKVLPWYAFDHLKMNESIGMLYIMQKEGQGFLGLRHSWVTISYGQVPNLALFQHLILSITGSPHS